MSGDDEWRVLATFASGLEADIALGRLEAAEIPVVRDSNDTVGLFGPGFQGPRVGESPCACRPPLWTTRAPCWGLTTAPSSERGVRAFR
jgi:hypothetical protein